MRSFAHFLSDEQGTSAIETCLITSLMGAALITALSDLGKELAAVFNYITAVLATALASASF